MDAMALKMTGRPLIPSNRINSPSGFSSGGGGDCPPDASLRSRNYQSPFLSYITIPATSGPAQADVPVLLPLPAKEIICVSCAEAQANDSLYMHFVPLNKNYGIATAIIPTGNEQWLPFSDSGSWGGNARRTGAGYKFSQTIPVLSLYFDIGHESGGSSAITFVIGDGAIDFWRYVFSA